MYTVKQLSDIAGVTVRTLHHYDDIGLLRPSRVGANGYRYYDDDALLRLQQVLFYREIGLELAHIRDILDSPDFDLVTALRSHRAVLLNKRARLDALVTTIDETISHLTGETPMNTTRMFEAFSDEQQRQYEREARLQWDADLVNDSIRRWNSYSQAQKDAIMAEAGQIYTDIVASLEAGLPPQHADVQAIIVRWQANMRHFYEPTLEIMRGLGDGYNSHPDFIANFQKLHPGLPPYLQAAITQYVDDLEHAEIVRMLAENEAHSTSNR